MLQGSGKGSWSGIGGGLRAGEWWSKISKSLLILHVNSLKMSFFILLTPTTDMWSYIINAIHRKKRQKAFNLQKISTV